MQTLRAALRYERSECIGLHFRVRLRPGLSVAVQNAEDQKNVTHHDVHEAAQVLMDYAGPTFERQSQSWSASLPNDAP